MSPLERFSPAEKDAIFRTIDHEIKMGEARPEQRQRALVMARFEIGEDETNYAYPRLEDLLPVVYEDKFYPANSNYLLRQAAQSLDSFVRSLMIGRKQAVSIAEEIRDEIGCNDLTSQETIDIVTRNMSFKDYAIRIGLKTEDNF